jgi:predicted Zn-dependent peptidase
MKQTTLSNGLTVIAVELPHLHTAAIAVHVRAGSRYETPQNNGISHFVEHMLYRGNHALGDAASLHRAAASLGGMLEAHTQEELVEFEIMVEPGQVDAALGFLGAFLAAPRFDDIDVERARVLSEMMHYLEGDGQPQDRISCVRQLLFGDHPLGLLPIGRRENATAFQIEDVWEHFSTHYTGTNIVVGVAGPWDVDAVLVSAERHLDCVAPGSPVQSQRYIPCSRLPRIRHLPRHYDEVDLVLTFETAPRGLREEMELCALRCALGSGEESLLPAELSQKRGLVYATDASVAFHSDIHLLDVVAIVPPNLIGEVLHRTFAILGEVRRVGVEEELLDIVKRQNRRSFLSACDDCQWLASWVATNGLLGKPLPDLAANITIMDSFTPDTLRDAARRLMVPARTMVCLIGALENSQVGPLRWRAAGRIADELHPHGPARAGR